MRLGGIVDLSTVDWHGNVSLVVFFAGCNFHCPYCQNSSLIPLDSGKEVDAEYLKNRVKVGRNLIDSVVFTGGEPLQQPNGLRNAAEIAKELGLKTMLDTNGCRPDIIEELLSDRLIDRIALDIKAPLNPDDYAIFVENHLAEDVTVKIGESLDICNRHRVEVEVRTTVAPGISDDPSHIRAIAARLTGNCDVYYLQQYDNQGDVLSPELKNMAMPEKEILVELAEIASSEGVELVFIKTRKSGLERIR